MDNKNIYIMLLRLQQPNLTKLMSFTQHLSIITFSFQLLVVNQTM